MTEYSIVKATYSHATQLADNMRQADIDEVIAVTQKPAIHALIDGVDKGAWVALVDDNVLCMFGLINNSYISKAACPWLLSSKELPKHPLYFLKGSKKILKEWSDHYEVLFNYVDARYTSAIKWLDWLGFTIHPAENYGRGGRKFHKFEMVKK